MDKPLNFFQTRPKVEAIDLKAYLERINVDGEPPSLNLLKKLHKAHLLNIPFENLDIHLKRKITLDPKRIFTKVIHEKRGGLCFELNLLFFHLLNHLNFNVQVLSARVFKDGTYTPEFDHMILLVHFDRQSFLCDVGFGNSFIYPKKLLEATPQLDFTTYYKLDRDPDGRWILKKSDDNISYETLYRFETKKREMIEFLDRCEYHQMSTDSIFRKHKLITKLLPNGRVTLTDKKIKFHLPGEIKENEILNQDEFYSKLSEYFGINSSDLMSKQSD